MHTIETFSCTHGAQISGRKELSSWAFFIAAALGDRADCMRAWARDLPVRLGRVEAPRGDRGFLRRSVSARLKARDD